MRAVGIIDLENFYKSMWANILKSKCMMRIDSDQRTLNKAADSNDAS